MPEYSDPKKIIWYDDVPCPVCGAEHRDTMVSHRGLAPCPGV